MSIMRVGKLFWLPVLMICWTACSDDDGGDDTVLDLKNVTGKYWYSLNWANNPEGYTTDDLVEVVKLEDNGKVWTMDFGGRTEKEAGRWESGDNNDIALHYYDGTTENWGVLHNGSDYLTVRVNKGERKYVTEPAALEEMTGDAFLVNEVKNAGAEPLRIGIAVCGKNAVNISSSSAVIVAPGEVFRLSYQTRSKTWTDKGDIFAGDFGLPGAARDILFSIKVSGQQLKFRDRIYTENLPSRTFREFGLDGINEGQTLYVEWNPFAESGVYYRVEVFPTKASDDPSPDLASPYFISQLYANTGSLEITSGTKTEGGTENKIGDLRKGQKYVVRLSAILLEPGIDYNHKYGSANIQAVTYVQRSLVWGE